MITLSLRLTLPLSSSIIANEFLSSFELLQLPRMITSARCGAMSKNLNVFLETYTSWISRGFPEGPRALYGSGKSCPDEP